MMVRLVGPIRLKGSRVVIFKVWDFSRPDDRDDVALMFQRWL